MTQYSLANYSDRYLEHGLPKNRPLIGGIVGCTTHFWGCAVYSPFYMQSYRLKLPLRNFFQECITGSSKMPVKKALTTGTPHKY